MTGAVCGHLLGEFKRFIGREGRYTKYEGSGEDWKQESGS